MAELSESLTGLRNRIFDELNSVEYVDPHTHINALDPASHSLADILGYHYYTELAHSAGLPKEKIEGELSPKELVSTLVEKFDCLSNTIQYSWFQEMLAGLFDVDPEFSSANWESVFDAVQAKLDSDDWTDQVFAKSNLKAVFLTNDFDDKLEGFDTQRYIPCLRTDDLVFHLSKPETVNRLSSATDSMLPTAKPSTARSKNSSHTLSGTMPRHVRSHCLPGSVLSPLPMVGLSERLIRY